MADTIRTRAEVLAILTDADGGGRGGSACSTRDIHPQGLRDAIVSLFGVYGAIYCQDAAVGQTGVTTTPELLTEWTGNGLSSGTTPDYVNDKITVDNDGIYLVFAQLSFGGDAAPTTWQFHIRVDAVESAYGVHRKTSTTDVGACSIVGLLSLSATEEVTIYVESAAGAGAGLTLVDAQLVLLRVA